MYCLPALTAVVKEVLGDSDSESVNEFFSELLDLASVGAESAPNADDNTSFIWSPDCIALICC